MGEIVWFFLLCFGFSFGYISSQQEQCCLGVQLICSNKLFVAVLWNLSWAKKFRHLFSFVTMHLFYIIQQVLYALFSLISKLIFNLLVYLNRFANVNIIVFTGCTVPPTLCLCLFPFVCLSSRCPYRLLAPSPPQAPPACQTPEYFGRLGVVAALSRTSSGRWTPSWFGPRTRGERFSRPSPTCTTPTSARSSVRCTLTWSALSGSTLCPTPRHLTHYYATQTKGRCMYCGFFFPLFLNTHKTHTHSDFITSGGIV